MKALGAKRLHHKSLRGKRQNVIDIEEVVMSLGNVPNMKRRSFGRIHRK
jgi:hypothetical protein